MKITETWIAGAIDALVKSGIVVKQQDSTIFSFPKEFKGYISSFAATIVQSGLLPALVIYEQEDSDAAASRYLLPRAIVCLLVKLHLLELRKNFQLSDYWDEAVGAGQKQEFQANVEKALMALKLAIRLFKPAIVEGRNRNKEINSGEQQIQAEPEIERVENEKPLLAENRFANVGWLYFRDYYHDFKNWNFTNEQKNKHEYILKNKKNPFLFNSQLDKMLNSNNRLEIQLKEAGFESLTFKTLYPGLVIGLGLSHGTPAKNDLKCGFQFDYTTGLPVIPGSSVKGVLRSVFPDPAGEMDDRNRQKACYIGHLLAKQSITLKADELFSAVQNLAEQIFMHGDADSRGIDIFMDAIITGPANGRFLADDYLTPHNGYKNPVPIQFMKVLPNIEFTFFFKLTPYYINGVQIDKLALFCHILEDVGIGAKTNVGYGHLKVIKNK